MRHANEHANAFLFGGVYEVPARVLLENIIDNLEGRYLPVLNKRQALRLPTICGAQRCSVAANLTGGFQAIESLEELVAADGCQPRVVNLIDVDVIRAQAPKALLKGEPYVLRRKILRKFLMAVPFDRVVVEVIAELGGDDDAITHVGERVCEYRLPFALSIRVGSVEERNTGFVSLSQKLDAAAIIID